MQEQKAGSDPGLFYSEHVIAICTARSLAPLAGRGVG